MGLLDCTVLPKSSSKSLCSLDVSSHDQRFAVKPHEVDEPEDKTENPSSLRPRLKAEGIWQGKTAKDSDCDHRTPNFIENDGEFVEDG